MENITETASAASSKPIPVIPKSHLMYSPAECLWVGRTILLLVIVGTIANTKVLIIYATRREKTMSDYLIIYATSLSLVGCSVQMPLEYFGMFAVDDPVMGCNVFSFAQYYLSLHVELATAFALTVIAFERYISVCRPFSQNVTPCSVVTTLVLSNIVAAILGGVVIFCVKSGGYWVAGDIVHGLHGFLQTLMLFVIGVFYTHILRTLHVQTVNVNRWSKLSTVVKFPVTFPIMFSTNDGNQTIDDHKMENANKSKEAPMQISTTRDKLEVVYEGNSGVPKSDQEPSNSNDKANILLSAALKRKRKVLNTILVITLLYIVCFIPGSILSQIVYWNPNIILNANAVGATFIRYVQLIYNLNFVLSPFVYAIMAERFRSDVVVLCQRLRDRFRNMPQLLPLNLKEQKVEISKSKQLEPPV